MKQVATIIAFTLFSILSISNSCDAQQNTSDKMVIKTKQGNVTINDITKNPVEVISGQVYFGKTKDYSMWYNKNDKSFHITLESYDIQTSRKNAEDTFLKKLGINKNEACLISPSLGVTRDINESASVRNHGLSFCKNGVPFSKAALDEAKFNMKNR